MTDAPVLSVATGAVRGVREDGIDRYLGIPYAAPPFGELRFLPPQPPSSWAGERDATAFGATAPQLPYQGGTEKYLSSVEVPGDDILTVNVWTPADRDPATKLPVLVFVHGGALTRGTTALAVYDGATFARQGIVYVSIQYRLGQEGFAVLEGVPQNLGVLDQQAALRWVRREIGAFGGDAGRVTVMGHSAGANTLTALLALPHAAELFDQAILQSGPLQAQPPKKAGRMSREIAKRLGIRPTGAAFAAVAPAVLAQTQTAVGAGGSPAGGGPTVALVIGGEAVPVDPLEALVAGAVAGHPRPHRLDQRGVPALARPLWCGRPHPSLDAGDRRARLAGATADSSRPTAGAGPRRRPARCSARSSPTCCCGVRSRDSPTADQRPRRRPMSTSSAGGAASTGSAPRTAWSSASSSTPCRRRMPSP